MKARCVQVQHSRAWTLGKVYEVVDPSKLPEYLCILRDNGEMGAVVSWHPYNKQGNLFELITFSDYAENILKLK